MGNRPEGQIRQKQEEKDEEENRKFRHRTFVVPIKTENRSTACRLKMASVLRSLYCLLLCEVNFRNQNYFSHPHENKTFSLPYCRQIKLQILKKKSYTYWFTLLGVVTWSLEGCNPYPLVTLGSGMRRLPYDPPPTRNVISVSKPSRVGGRHSPLYAPMYCHSKVRHPDEEAPPPPTSGVLYTQAST
jgi:hypothetical protein